MQFQFNSKDTYISWEELESMVARRELAAKQVTPCEVCGSLQVQLVDWATPTLKMKCRKCKHKFTKEVAMENAEEYSEVVAGFEAYVTNNGKAPVPTKGKDGNYLSAQMQARFIGFKAAYEMFVTNK